MLRKYKYPASFLFVNKNGKIFIELFSIPGCNLIVNCLEKLLGSF